MNLTVHPHRRALTILLHLIRFLSFIFSWLAYFTSLVCTIRHLFYIIPFVSQFFRLLLKCFMASGGRNEGGQTHLQREALHKIRIGRIRRTTLHDPPRLFGIGRRSRTEAWVSPFWSQFTLNLALTARLKRKVLTPKEIDKMKDSTPPLSQGSARLFRSLRDKGTNPSPRNAQRKFDTNFFRYNFLHWIPLPSINSDKYA